MPDQYAAKDSERYYHDLGTHGFADRGNGVLTNVEPIAFPAGKYTILKVGVFTPQSEKHIMDVNLIGRIGVQPGDQVSFPSGAFTADLGGLAVLFENKLEDLRCKHCGFENFHDTRRCKSCGVPAASVAP